MSSGSTDDDASKNFTATKRKLVHQNACVRKKFLRQNSNTIKIVYKSELDKSRLLTNTGTLIPRQFEACTIATTLVGPYRVVTAVLTRRLVQ